mgnify:CR=1 FL=1
MNVNERSPGLVGALTYRATYAEEAVHEPNLARRTAMIRQVRLLKRLLEPSFDASCSAFPDLDTIPSPVRQKLDELLDSILHDLEPMKDVPLGTINRTAKRRVSTKSREFIMQLENLIRA